MNRSLALLPLAALATACQAPMEGRFDFDDAYAGDLQSQTYAVGAAVDVVIWGPEGFDMNFTKARALDVGDEASAVDITVDTAYPEYGCVVAKGEASVLGTGRIAIADKLTGGTLDFVDVDTDTVDQIDLGRSLGGYGGRVDTETLGEIVNVLAGGATSLGVAPVNAAGDVLAGRFEGALETDGLSADIWDDGFGSVLWIDDARSGSITVNAAGLEHRVEVVAVPADRIASIELTEVSLSVGGDMTDWVAEQRGVLLTGRTADGQPVLGLQGQWTVDGWDYGVGDGISVWDEGAVQACWNGLCSQI